MTAWPAGRRQMTLKDAALILDVTPDTLRQAIHRGSLRGVKVGPMWLVTYREVDRYRHEQRRRRPVARMRQMTLGGGWDEVQS